MQPDGYTVKTEQFQGPLELLLSLIEKRKFHINDISLAEVADDFIAYAKSHEHLPTSEAAQFILVASILVLIKSRSLLPALTLTDEETGNIEDLELRLKKLQRFRALSRHIEERFGQHIIFAREPSRKIHIVFSPHKRITIENMRLTIKYIIAALPKADTIPQLVIKKIFSLDEMMGELSGRIQRALSMSFTEFSGGTKSTGVRKDAKIRVIVSFLAMLELVKRGIIEVKQDEHFRDIQMESQDISVPKYI
ncbi:MAG: hypothetical protein COW88_00530 [Candidatus Lloydbacteria bacterium CG22_combo_CG10-13_8_21_14_all_47_15]|uniref:Segregation and condensation protein A n=1 Tax=Candidatus Lloydbacteria bacterium CG22_combo_CG10-13_8_21_14_all_47_15 TaxID=1974635 RepID=A0A2H0CVL4_9BACT|nr:MAG: hypothetical protein COW88_00530 [Candidatus Lloydbacteria bacterium CG22_combo_CG10-13_8_21_14_all_47_15]